MTIALANTREALMAKGFCWSNNVQADVTSQHISHRNQSTRCQFCSELSSDNHVYIPSVRYNCTGQGMRWGNILDISVTQVVVRPARCWETKRCPEELVPDFEGTDTRECLSTILDTGAWCDADDRPRHLIIREVSWQELYTITRVRISSWDVRNVTNIIVYEYSLVREDGASPDAGQGWDDKNKRRLSDVAPISTGLQMATFYICLRLWDGTRCLCVPYIKSWKSQTVHWVKTVIQGANMKQLKDVSPRAGSVCHQLTIRGVLNYWWRASCLSTSLVVMP